MTDFSQKIKDEMNAAVLRGDTTKLKNFVLTEDKSKIYTLFRGDKKFYEVLYDIALNDKAPAFEKILSKFSDDENALDAILRGFKADERFNNQTGGDDRFGPSRDHADLEKKRAALLDLLTGKKPKPWSRPSSGWRD